MSSRNFRELIEQRWDEGKFVCVGLDSEFAKLPERMGRMGPGIGQYVFNAEIVDTTADLVCAYKPNCAFYEAEGAKGFRALEDTVQYINRRAPNVPVILDAKRADIGNTNNGYIKAAFEIIGADAITVHPYLGQEDGLQPLLDCKDKGIFVLCRTSNKGASEFQDLLIGDPRKEGPDEVCFKVYEYVALRVAKDWNRNNNCGLVTGATYPDELRTIRRLVEDLPLLIPGIGKQGGDVEATVKAGKDSRGRGMIINSSRDIIFASSGEDFAEAARRETEALHNRITQYL